MGKRLTVSIVYALVALFSFGLRANAGEGKSATNSRTGPEVRSAAALVVDATNGDVLFERDAGLVQPIASITKLMTALVVLDGKQSLDEVIQITADDRWKGKGAHSRLPVGVKLTRGDLLRLALMASENLAAHDGVRPHHEPEGKGARDDAHAFRRRFRALELQRVECARPGETRQRGVA